MTQIPRPKTESGILPNIVTLIDCLGYRKMIEFVFSELKLKN